MTAPRFIARSEAARLAIGRTPGLDLCRNKAQWHTLLHKRADKAPFVSCGSIRESSLRRRVNHGPFLSCGGIQDSPPGFEVADRVVTSIVDLQAVRRLPN